MAEPDYGPQAAFRRNRKLLFKLTSEIDDLIEGKIPKEVNFQDVGCLAEAKLHLEKAIKHIRDYRKAHRLI
jgi:hypothetical protein